MRSDRAPQHRLLSPSEPSVDGALAQAYSRNMKRSVVGSARRASRPPVDARAAFLARLSRRLSDSSYALLRCELGRESAGAKRGVWMLTLELPNQNVLTLRAPLAADQDPFAADVCDDIAGRVIAHLSK